MIRVALLVTRFPGVLTLAAAAALWAIFLADPAHGSVPTEPPNVAWCAQLDPRHLLCADERRKIPSKWRDQAVPVPLESLKTYERYTPVLPKEK